MNAASRLEARLALLPLELLKTLAGREHGSHAELVALAAKRDMPEGLSLNEAALAAHAKLPDWARSGVLLSSDLLPFVFQTFGAGQAAAALVCSAWAACWRSTLQSRRILQPCLPPLEMTGVLDEDGDSPMIYHMVALDGERLLIKGYEGILVVDQQLQTRPDPIVDAGFTVHAAGFLFPSARGYTSHAGSLYTLGLFDNSVRRYDVNTFAQLAETQAPWAGDSMVVAAGSLFTFDHAASKIHALDALTLVRRFDFETHIVRRSPSRATMTVLSDELYLCDHGDDCLRVFSLDGQPLREVRGRFWRPTFVCSAQDRIYLVESSPIPSASDPLAALSGATSDDDGEATRAEKAKAGKRVVVLTPEGRTLQSYSIPDLLGVDLNSWNADSFDICGLAIFDGKLIAAMQIPSMNSMEKLVALQGV